MTLFRQTQVICLRGDADGPPLTDTTIPWFYGQVLALPLEHWTMLVNEAALLVVGLAKELGVTSGVSDVIEDEVQLALADYQQFVGTVLAEYQRSLHGLLRSMTAGFLAPASVLLHRAGGTLPSFGPEHDATWAQLMSEQSALMPR